MNAMPGVPTITRTVFLFFRVSPLQRRSFWEASIPIWPYSENDLSFLVSKIDLPRMRSRQNEPDMLSGSIRLQPHEAKVRVKLPMSADRWSAAARGISRTSVFLHIALCALCTQNRLGARVCMHYRCALADDRWMPNECQIVNLR